MLSRCNNRQDVLYIINQYVIYDRLNMLHRTKNRFPQHNQQKLHFKQSLQLHFAAHALSAGEYS